MQRMMARLALVATLAAAVGVSTALPAAAAGSGGDSDVPEYCDAFAEYYEVSFAIGIVTGFAEAFGEKGDLDAGEARNVAYLILSPKLEPLTAELADSAPRALRKLFVLQADVYGQGVDLLSDLGLTDEQIDAIAEADLSNFGDSKKFTNEFDITKQQVTDAAADLGRAIDDAKGSIEPSPRQERAFDKLSNSCGVSPDTSIDCDELVPAADVEALIGEVAEQSGSCQWEAVEPETGLTPKLSVEVFRSAKTYEDRKETNSERLTEVTGVGDEAYITPGFTSQTSGSTCGKTIYVLSGSDTILAALCQPDDVDPSDDQMTQLADFVIGQLADQE